MCSSVSPYLGLADKVAELPIVILGSICIAALCLLFDLNFTYMSLPSQGSVSFSSGIPCSDLNMLAVLAQMLFHLTAVNYLILAYPVLLVKV